MKRLKLLIGPVLLAGFFAGTANAQAGGFGTDYLSKIQFAANQMVDGNIGLFVGEGLNLLHSVALVLLVYMLILALFSKHAALENFVQFVFLYLIAYGMLQFYDAPMPWGTTSFHSIFAAEADWINNAITSSVINDLVASIKKIRDSAEVPISVNVVGLFYYGGLMIALSVLWFLSFGITAVSYIAMAVGGLLGPLFIPFVIWPFMSWLFTGWLRYMVIYALWRVMTTVVISIFANVLLWYINSAVLVGAQQISLAQMGGIVPVLYALILADLFALWFSYIFARDMVSGSASMGNPMAAMAGTAAAMILR